MKKYILFLVSLFFCLSSMAQEDVSMADEMRANGKIYVVVAVVLTIFIGIVLYLVRLDRKLSKLEKKSGL